MVQGLGSRWIHHLMHLINNTEDSTALELISCTFWKKYKVQCDHKDFNLDATKCCWWFTLFLSQQRFVHSRICSIKGLSPLDLVSLGFLHLRVCPLQGLSPLCLFSLGFIPLGLVYWRVCPCMICAYFPQPLFCLFMLLCFRLQSI